MIIKAYVTFDLPDAEEGDEKHLAAMQEAIHNGLHMIAEELDGDIDDIELK